MLISLKNAVIGSQVHALDGTVGSIHDAFFNGVLWNLRYFVINTGSWLQGRKVLLSPAVIHESDWNERVVKVNLTTEQVKESPGIDADAPVSRQMEEELAEHFRWPAYWGMGVTGTPVGSATGERPTNAEVAEVEEELCADNPQLRSVNEVKGYAIAATDGDIGHVEDFMLDDVASVIRYMVVNTGNWGMGKSILVAPAWVQSIHWSERKVHVGLPRESFQQAPTFDPKMPINRQFEEHLYDSYGRERYWSVAPTPPIQASETSEKVDRDAELNEVSPT